jgi:hypothetical protein
LFLIRFEQSGMSCKPSQRIDTASMLTKTHMEAQPRDYIRVFPVQNRAVAIESRLRGAVSGGFVIASATLQPSTRIRVNESAAVGGISEGDGVAV